MLTYSFYLGIIRIEISEINQDFMIFNEKIHLIIQADLYCQIFFNNLVCILENSEKKR